MMTEILDRNPNDNPSAQLLDWYDGQARVLPWRAPPGSAEPTPAYRVWLSEVMLQQTTVATVKNYFQYFTERWPTVSDLAAAPLDDVLHAWQGLGYYARARNLHKCAQTIANDHGGRFPDNEEALLKLPGIGPYTAAAIAAIAFDRPSVAVDGNIERVISRQFAILMPLPDSKPEIKARATERLALLNGRFGDYTQALMDLGATVCTPKSPTCLTCPILTGCEARLQGIAESLPRKQPKKQKPTRQGIVFWAEDPAGRVLMRRRAESGLLGGMDEIPSTQWIEGDEALKLEAVLDQAPAKADYSLLPGEVKHTFTHFHLLLRVAVGKVTHTGPEFVSEQGFADKALPTVMKKVIAHRLIAQSD